MQADNHDKIYDYSKNIDLSDMCADIHYFLILPFSAMKANYPQNNKVVPYVVTYKDDTVLIGTIISDFKKMSKEFKEKKIYLTQRKSHRLVETQCVRDMKKELGKQNLDGLALFVEQLKSNVDSDEDIYFDECCLKLYLEDQSELDNQKTLKLTVEIPLDNKQLEVIQVSMIGDSTGENIVEEIIKTIKMEYGVNLKRQDIKSLDIKESKMPVTMAEPVLAQTIYNKSIIKLNLTNPSTKLKRISSKDYNSYLIIYKEGQKEPLKYKFSEISQLTFSMLYTTKLQLDESKMKKDSIYCLKIMDMIIKPQEKINKAEVYFRSNSNEPVNVVAKVVNQKMVFYHTIPDIAGKGKEFSLDELKIPPNQTQKRNQCRELSKTRAKEAKIEYFKKNQNLEPILIYTSQLKYEEGPQNYPIIYASLNKFLRQNPLLALNEDKISSEWRYRYASTLLEHLEKIPRFEGKTYRGINYDPKAKKGEIMTFKQFLSTSTNRQTALSFAKKANSGTHKHLFQFSIKSGYPIKQFSQYEKEEEVLMEPFTEFQVVNVRQQKILDCDFMIYRLYELQTSKKLPVIKANFVVWVDDKPKEGKLIFDKIDIPLESTILVQILSTQQLKKWLSKNGNLFTDLTANLIFVTNMTRKEGEQLNQFAGIEGLREIRKYDEKKSVFFYVGDKSKAMNKCKEKKVSLGDLIIGNTAREVYGFITKQIVFAG